MPVFSRTISAFASTATIAASVFSLVATPLPALAKDPPAQANNEVPACPPPGTKVDVKEKSALAQDTGSSVVGTAGSLLGTALLGPLGAAAAMVVGAHAGKKVGGAVKDTKQVDIADVRPECSAQNQAARKQATEAAARPKVQLVPVTDQPAQAVAIDAPAAPVAQPAPQQAKAAPVGAEQAQAQAPDRTQQASAAGDAGAPGGEAADGDGQAAPLTASADAAEPVAAQP